MSCGGSSVVSVAPICETMAKDEKKAACWRVRTQYLAVALNRKDGKVGVLKKGKTVFTPLTSYNEDPDWGVVLSM